MRNLPSKRLISLLTVKRKDSSISTAASSCVAWPVAGVLCCWHPARQCSGRANGGAGFVRLRSASGLAGVPGRRRRGWRACVLPALSFVRGSASVGGHLAGGGGGGACAGGVATLLSSLGRVVGTVSSCWLFGGPGRCRGGEAVRWFSSLWPRQALLLCLCLGRVGTNRS